MGDAAWDAQAEALRAFTMLALLRSDWAGALVLVCGLGARGSAVSTACNIAGAVCLAIDPRPEACRAALLSGACDFVVNTVDEALRILKNQIRQRRPVSVALEAAPDAAVGELIDRGMLPELFTELRSDTDLLQPTTRDRALQSFMPLGTLIVDFGGSLAGVAEVIDASAILESATTERGLKLESFEFESAEALRAFDARLLAAISPEDARHRWCVAAPRFFHRERPHRRVVFLTVEEQSTLRQT
jgi:threonine dehydrogenase-like Zn-dependent dehydrogenase